MARRSSEEIFQLLITSTNASPEGESYRGKCPCHDDTSEDSLYISRGDKGILLHCHAGCSHVDVAYSFGITRTELFHEEFRFSSPPPQRGQSANSSRKPLGKLISEFNYVDANGTLLYQVCKFDGGSPDADKQFRQRRKLENGEWCWGLQKGKYRRSQNGTWKKAQNPKQEGDISLGAVETILYRLPDLLRDETGTTTFIVEGEKDVDRLRSLGLAATCNTGGASKDPLKPKWQASDSETLWGRGEVIVIPDNDDAGRAHGPAVAKALQGVVTGPIKVLYLPGLADKGDVSNWLDAGGTVDQLSELATTCPEFDPAEITKPTIIANYIETGDGKEPLPMERIIGDVKSLTNDWPRRVGNALFVPSDSEKVDWFENADEFFGWVGLRSVFPPKFARVSGVHSRGEVFQTMRRSAKAYQHIELFPHCPPIQNHYYACNDLPTSDGSSLQKLIDFFSPATDVDRQLILSLFTTLFWGGPLGKRPLFVITSDSGRGAGKTELAAIAGMIVGGTIDLSSKEDAEHIKQRILSPEGMRSRIALLDNVKSLHFSWAELEAFITCRSISGKRMYIGEARRPNQITWIITLNGASMGTDMAQRHVTIKLGKPKYVDQWFTKVETFVDKHRKAIVADCLRFFSRERNELQRHSRWGPWEFDVLKRLDDPDEVQALILERQAESNVETEEGGIIEEAFEQNLVDLGYSVGADEVWIPSKLAAQWYNEATGERNKVAKVSRILRQKITEKEITKLSVCLNTHRRGFIWMPDAEEDRKTIYDIEAKLEYQQLIK